MNADSPTTGWIKATLSGGSGSGDCVEMRRHGAAVQVRDSKHPDDATLTVTPAQFSQWVSAARRGEFPTSA
jgi:hypothetical protein